MYTALWWTRRGPPEGSCSRRELSGADAGRGAICRVEAGRSVGVSHEARLPAHTVKARSAGSIVP